MKKIFLISLACAGVLGLAAQGTLQLSAGAQIKTSGGGWLVLDNMNLVNNGTLQQVQGNGYTKFTGSQSVSLSGNGTTTLDVLQLAKDPGTTLNLQSNIAVVGKVNFSGGLLNLGNSVLDLGPTGNLTGESEGSRAFTAGPGYIQAKGDLNAPSSKDLGSLGAVITSKANLGTTFIRRGHQVQTGISGANNSIQRYYDIVPTNNLNLKATLRFYYFDAELNGIPEDALYQWKSKDNVNWEFVGTNSRDMAANYVEHGSINWFARWTLAIAKAPTITCPANITASANQKGCKASVSFAATATGDPAPTITYRIGNTVITSPYTFPKGTTTVTATATNGVAPDATCSFTVTVVCAPTGPVTAPVTETREVQSAPLVMTARPNPTAGYFTLNLSSGGQSPVSLKVVDVLGRVVERRTNLAANTVLYLGQGYRPGVYYVQAVQGPRIAVLRLVKQSE